MKRFLKRFQRDELEKEDAAKKAAIEEKRLTKEAEDKEMLRRSFALKKQASRKFSSNSVSPDKKIRLSEKSGGSSAGSNKESNIVATIGQRDNTQELED